jgi:hypothetical protein
MRGREFTSLADEVADACQRHGVPVWSEDDRDRLNVALWRFVHPDLAHTSTDSYLGTAGDNDE